jgi:hypothetical protein
MQKHPSKNSLCPCGSGKKYKNCHRKNELLIKKVTRLFQEKEKKEKDFLDKFGHARKPNFIKSGDTAYVAIGNEIFKQSRPGEYNFVNAVHDYALHFFSVPYLEEQEAKPYEDRHPAMQWLHTSVEMHNEILKNPDATPEDFSTGAFAAWGRLAYDLYTVKDNANIEKRMRERLFSAKDFQGARHELTVIALFVAAGFEIKFEDEKDNSKKHSEFIAIHKRDATEVAVEAKSRHRHGIKGFSGGVKMEPREKVNIRSLVTDAYQKMPTRPFYIFVDVNLPPVQEDDWQRWLQEIHDTMMDLAAEGYTDPCPANGVFFFNDPSHYMLTEKTVNPSADIWIKKFIAEKPTIPHPEFDVAALVLKAHRQRVSPPEEIPQ